MDIENIKSYLQRLTEKALLWKFIDAGNMDFSDNWFDNQVLVRVFKCDPPLGKKDNRYKIVLSGTDDISMSYFNEDGKKIFDIYTNMNKVRFWDELVKLGFEMD